MKPSEAIHPGIYQFRHPNRGLSYLRKFDGKVWYVGGDIKAVAVTSRSPSPTRDIDNWVMNKMTVELVADLSGNPWTGPTEPPQIQLELF